MVLGLESGYFCGASEPRRKKPNNKVKCGKNTMGESHVPTFREKQVNAADL